MRGWILDLYAERPGKMVVWVRLEDGGTRRLVDRWDHSIFVAADKRADLEELAKWRGLRRSRFVKKIERATDREESEVLEVAVEDTKQTLALAKRIEASGPFGKYRLYNVDVPPEQMYLYENDLFPLALCDVRETGRGLDWRLMDDNESCVYRLPPIRSAAVDVKVRKAGRLPTTTDPIGSIAVASAGETSVIDGGSEGDKILGMVELVRRLDPDLILTQDGDSFTLPYLITRAKASGVAGNLTLDREGTIMELPSKKGTSYFSYGKILFKPSAIKLLGRIHLDKENSFVCAESGMDGFYEMSRVCRLPMHTASRASIGKCLSSLQFYHATKDNILIPWKPALAEHFKSRLELLAGDRGGFIFEPGIGVHEQVGELDFSSLFPAIMSKKNISPETVRCSCCPDSPNRVPELGWNVCQRRPKGIVSKAVEVIVEKRLKYKALEKAARSEEERACYAARKNALKWVGVACLPRDSPVFVRQDGIDRFVKIGDFVDSLVGDRVGVMECPPGVFVAGVGHDYKAKYCKIARLIKKPNDQKLLSFAMENGRKIVTTPDHSFFVLREGELQVKRADELQIGELVPTAKKILSGEGQIRQIDLIESLLRLLTPEEQRLWRVSADGLGGEIGAKKQVLLRAAISEGYTYQAVINWIKSGIIPLRFFRLLEIPPRAHLTARIGAGRRGGGRNAWLPAVLQVDERLGFFLGLFVADGSATNTYVRLDIGLGEHDLLEISKKLPESIFGITPHVYKERKAEMYVVQINSASLVRVLEKIFGLPGSADRGKLKVPSVIFNCRVSVAHRFLAGLVAGDGHVGKRDRFVAVSTASKDFQNQIGFLAAKLGLAFRLGLKGAQRLYTVSFVGPETLGKIAEWEYSKENQRAKILAWSDETGACDHVRYERLPIGESGLFALASTTRTSSEPHARDGSRMCPVQASRKISRMQSRRLDDAQIEQLNRVEKLLDGDLGFVRIRKIERLEDDPEYVYCFQLEESEVPAFFTGQGAILTRNCFGYLGFNNAKFGRIDAHMAVCAWDRKILMDAARVAERRGFRVVHGIVDSLWLKKEGAREDEFRRLAREIREETGFDIVFEGLYKWIAFPPSKTSDALPVLNRYFGTYRDGKVKVRGIEARRHDTPHFFSECQAEILGVLAGARSVDEARGMVDECVRIFLLHARELLEQKVPLGELVYTRNLSRKPDEYVNRSLTASVADQLVREGVELHAGESVEYVITDYESTGRRAVPLDLVDERTRYDAERYVELLAEACSTVLEPFNGDCSSEGLAKQVGERLHESLEAEAPRLK